MTAGAVIKRPGQPCACAVRGTRGTGSEIPPPVQPLKWGGGDRRTIRFWGNPSPNQNLRLESPILETKWNQPDIWGAGGGGVSSLNPAPHAIQQRTFLLPLPTATKQLHPEDPSLLGYAREFSAKKKKSCLGSPQIPPVPYNCSVNVSSSPTVPSQDSHNRRSTGETPPNSAAPAPLTPSLGFCPYSLAREARKLVPAPLTASSSLRAASLRWPAVRSPGRSPALPPACPPRGPGLRPPGYSELAERRQRAPPGPGGHCLLSSPNPPPHRRRRPTPSGGGDAPGSGRDGRRRRGPFLLAGRRPLLT